MRNARVLGGFIPTLDPFGTPYYKEWTRRRTDERGRDAA
jgi:hypothetical protein